MLKDGVYTETEKGQMSDVTVEVTLGNNTIETVKILEENETPGIGDIALERIPQAIIEKQSFEIDTFSGATLNSQAILSAVKKVLEKANE